MRATSSRSSSVSPRRGALSPQRTDALPVVRCRIADERGDDVGEAGGKPRDGAGGTGRQPLRDERLGADEDVEPVEEVRGEAVPGRVGNLEADEVRRLLTEACERR